jgi:hypothetical protein
MTADARARHNLRIVPSYMVSRLHQLFNEYSELASHLSSLLVNLYYLRRTAEDETEPVVILLCGRATGAYLRGLSALGLLPRLNVISPRDREELAARVADLYQAGHSRRVIVARDLYFKHHSVFLTAAPQAFRVL